MVTSSFFVFITLTKSLYRFPGGVKINSLDAVFGWKLKVCVAKLPLLVGCARSLVAPGECYGNFYLMFNQGHLFLLAGAGHNRPINERSRNLARRVLKNARRDSNFVHRNFVRMTY